MRLLAALAFALALPCGACDMVMQPAGMIPRWTSAWRDVATSADRERLRDWRKTFVDAVAAAKRSGHSPDIAKEGAVLDPDAALASAPLPDGMYRCRVIKLGAKTEGMLDFVSYPAFACRVRADRDLKRIEKLTGSQRYIGLVFPNDAMRQVFLGTLVLGDETRAMQYGEDPDRNIAGYVERIGAARWRLVMPRPQFESQLDVMELVPSEGARG
ncbi:MAG TPA: DUF4893 domain-containing protein [Sphingomicrobium sp.]|nr:DUF4893 domain-containing protein [Sphingomicrobium sp.]